MKKLILCSLFTIPGLSFALPPYSCPQLDSLPVIDYNFESPLIIEQDDEGALRHFAIEGTTYSNSLRWDVSLTVASKHFEPGEIPEQAQLPVFLNKLQVQTSDQATQYPGWVWTDHQCFYFGDGVKLILTTSGYDIRKI